MDDVEKRIAEIAKDACVNQIGASRMAHYYQVNHAIRVALSDPVLTQAKWQPIETAPRDGTEILIAFEGIGVRQVSWQDPYGDNNDYAIWCVSDNKNGPYPLRGYSEGDELGWMPLPPPPKGDTK